jgi:hypothetical protein
MKTVRLLKNHTHAGEDYLAGDLLELRDDQVDRLIEMGSAELWSVPLPPLDDPRQKPKQRKRP